MTGRTTGPADQEAAALSAMGEALLLANEGRTTHAYATGGPAGPGPVGLGGGADSGADGGTGRSGDRNARPGPDLTPSLDPLAIAGLDTGSAKAPDPARDPAREPAHEPEPGREPGRDSEPRHEPEPDEPASRARTRHHDLTWPEARRAARAAGRRLPAVSRPLAGALGHALAAPLTALTDLPSFDTSAMDGWAVAGPGPWMLETRQLLAGQRPGVALLDGHAIAIATGAALPPGATAIIRHEHGRTERRTDGGLLHATHGAPTPGQDVRPRAQECRGGEELLSPGVVVTPAVLGLAAAAGYDELRVITRPRVEVLVLGDELLDHGLPHAGFVRDALGPMLAPWLEALGAEVTGTRRVVDEVDALMSAIGESTADLLITTGGTAAGPVDHVHPVLHTLGAKLLVDGVAVRPGHPMLLAELPGGGHLVGLPGNPLAAVSGVITLVAPLLRTLAGRPVPAPYTAELTADVPGHPTDTRLVPVVFDDESAVVPLHFHGPAMLRGLATADGLAVIPPGGAAAGQETAVLDLAWGTAGC
ncbi:molybdopterin molybdotransferase MoeA [Streptomyces sp. RKAG293]|uniref:molybdopterin molybdotransferase MoeA n=1 Tax=Streptomyces sp. RKAG293 TaxID=2893403 RepID=UPI002033CCF6|nr:molybdopterin molybdotransferase MoeA [Streptomyces sp. RKAG293]MCM2420490.1 molybdopterin molybdenumtransferase MoeA [Streptomyces sp. RKAG293]